MSFYLNYRVAWIQIRATHYTIEIYAYQTRTMTKISNNKFKKTIMSIKVAATAINGNL